jgi:hypothetical protein
MISASYLRLGAWLLGLAVIGLAITAWSQVHLTGRALTTYDIFPIFGLSAFSLMWTHYVVDAIRRYFKHDKRILREYFDVTSAAVLGLILLHPGIFLGKLWLDGYGLPPQSYFQLYTGLTQRVALLLGTFGLVAFLAYEFRREFSTRSWWRYVGYANIVAMFAIFYHALTLGDELELGWFRTLWWGYGITLLIAIGYNLKFKDDLADGSKVKEDVTSA